MLTFLIVKIVDGVAGLVGLTCAATAKSLSSVLLPTQNISISSPTIKSKIISAILITTLLAVAIWTLVFDLSTSTPFFLNQISTVSYC